MKYCKKCVLPDTRPGVVLDERGVCNGCRHTEYKKTVDWSLRKKEFQKLCDTYKKEKNEYDCIIAVSSGKDSVWQVHTLKDEFGMNPLLVNVDNSDWTETGLHNFHNMLDVFGVECITLKSNYPVNKKMSRIGFEHDGFVAWLFDRYIYTYPLWMAIKMDIPLIFYGENTNVEYGGPQSVETSSALNQINNDVVRDYGWDIWKDNGVDLRSIAYAMMPSKKEILNAKLNPVYMSYYFNWSGYQHMLLAKKYGWKSLKDTDEWKRKGYIEDYDQIDDFAYLVDPWMKYPKYGHARATDVACYWIRDGILTRDKAIELVHKHDHKLDPIALEHYLEFTGYTEDEFWEIVGKFWNSDIFRWKGKRWELKQPIWNSK